MIYRLLAVIVGVTALAACSSDMASMNTFKSGPFLDTVSFESRTPWC